MLPDHPCATSPALPAAPARVLLIDDEPSILRLLQRTLHRAGIACETVSSGCAALERLQAQHYDAVICDLRMPDLSGQQLHARICATAPEIAQRMIFSSGDLTTDDAATFLDRPGMRCIAKPFDLQHVVALVSQLLGDAEPASRDAAG